MNEQMQNNPLIDKRNKVAAIARAYLEHQISWQNFMDEIAQFQEDSLIDDLVDMIEHEPKQGGFMGVTEKEWQEYQRAILNIIGQLEK